MRGNDMGDAEPRRSRGRDGRTWFNSCGPDDGVAMSETHAGVMYGLKRARCARVNLGRR